VEGVGPRQRVTLAPGTVDVGGCVCQIGFYHDERADACLQCGDGTDCELPGATLRRLPLRRGNWRVAATSTTVRACHVAEACDGGTPPATVNSSIWAEHQCASPRPPAMHLPLASEHGRVCYRCARGYRGVVSARELNPRHRN
jgi:hypothetical protein